MVQNSGLLHATLCSVAIYAGAKYSFNTTLDIAYHKGEALNAITSQLDSYSNSPNDSEALGMLVATMATVASFEVWLLVLRHGSIRAHNPSYSESGRDV